MSIAVKTSLPSLGSTEGAVITKDDISVTEETSPSASAGEDLPRGKSAYEVAVENGFSGTETEWLASLKGATGAPGADGKDGTDGKTPYVGDNGNWYIGADDTGKPSRGAKGEPGEGGGYYTPAVTQPDANTIRMSFTPSKEDMPDVEPKDIILPAGGNGLTFAQINALDGMFKVCAFIKSDISAEYNAFRTAFGIEAATITGISATYSGGNVTAGTSVDELTGIVVTANYSDGSKRTVTGYTLSGTIAEGSNTITVTYEGMTTTFTVTGTAAAQVYTVTNHLTNVTNSNAATSVEAGGSYNATLTVADGCNLTSLTITMGGVDITDAVYGEGYILIPDVTGDIVITAAAAVPEYVGIATGIKTNIVNLYSDSGSTAIATKYYQTGAYSLNRTDTDAVVKVRLTNNTDGNISSSNVYIGSTDAQAIRNPNSSINVHYAISGSKGSVAAGASVEVEYTVRAGYWLYVCGYGGLDVSVVGALDVHEPTDVLTTTSKAIDTFTVYSDNGTTQLDKATYRTAYSTTEAFDVDTTIRITVVSGGANTGNILYGCAESGTLTASVNAYYGDSAVVNNFATGAALIIDYTVKAGYYFAVLPSAGATIYIEKI